MRSRSQKSPRLVDAEAHADDARAVVGGEVQAFGDVDVGPRGRSDCHDARAGGHAGDAGALSMRAATIPAQAVPWLPVGPPSGISVEAFQDCGCKSRSGWPSSTPSSITATQSRRASRVRSARRAAARSAASPHCCREQRIVRLYSEPPAGGRRPRSEHGERYGIVSQRTWSAPRATFQLGRELDRAALNNVEHR